MSRQVRGALFGEYVRMIRRSKNVDWRAILPAGDINYVLQRIDAESWYPMSTFERLGLAILAQFEGASLEAVRLWGSFSARQFATENGSLIASGDPAETLMRLRVLRATLFDFRAFEIVTLEECRAEVTVSYHMGHTAEEAASHQTLGFCEGVLAMAGAENIKAHFQEQSWAGDERTLIILQWSKAL